MPCNDFFRQLTGFEPSPFQLRVADAVLNEKNIILRAPTGSGKTWAVVAPFLYAAFQSRPIADRLLYALPLRSLATSLFKSTIRDATDCEFTRTLCSRIRIQTGEMKEDPLFEGLITFSTIDQLLSSYLLQPVGLPKRCGNINAGAVLGSLICFDEFHLLEPQRSMATAVEMLHHVTVANSLSRFVLMTATLSTQTLKWLAAKLNAVLIDLPQDEVQSLPSQVDKVRKYRWVDAPLSASAVANAHGNKRTIVIVNSVDRAQKIYEELQSDTCRELLGPATQIRLIHSRFYPSDRKIIELELESWFGKNATQQDVILVSTQVIEAGLDFSSDNLHTEVAPMNAIVQRAGRCARRTGENGTVWCYPLMRNSDGRTAYGPYSEVRSLVDATADSLRDEFGLHPKQVTFHDELKLVDQVHTEWELQQLRPLDNLSNITSAVRIAMNGDNPTAVRNLIRDVSSINVLITDNPDSITFDKETWPEMLSISPYSLYRLFNKDGTDSPWIAKSAEEQDTFNGGRLVIKWKEIERPDELALAGWLIAIHPSKATYRADTGLIIGAGGPTPAIRNRARPKFERYSYSYELYVDHIRRVSAAGKKRDEFNQVASHRLAEWMQVSDERFGDWLEFLYQLHDVGKLSIEWQDAIWNWQATKSGPPHEPRPVLAHSDFNPDIDRPAPGSSRPPHAAEGAFAICKHLESEINDSETFKAVLTAITRHHGPFTSALGSFRLCPQTSAIFSSTPQVVSQLLDAPKLRVQQQFKNYLVQATAPEDARTLLLYLYFVRRLRIADQNSFSEN